MCFFIEKYSVSINFLESEWFNLSYVANYIIKSATVFQSLNIYRQRAAIQGELLVSYDMKTPVI